jgi:hypothetical protein
LGLIKADAFCFFFQEKKYFLPAAQPKRTCSRRAVSRQSKRGPVCLRCRDGRVGVKGSSSFLKKRTKKLFLCLERQPQDKSFLFLFFKKEIFLPLAVWATR